MVWYFLLVLIAVTLVILAGLSIYKINQERKNKKQVKLTKSWRNYFEEILASGDSEDLLMKEDYFKKLRSIENLMAFFAATKEYQHSEQMETNELFKQFIRKNKCSWVKLGEAYKQKHQVDKAYYAYICEQLCVNEPEEYDDLTELMLNFAVEPSINSRENALKALYAFGNVDAVVEAFVRLSQNERPHHRKLVTDGLLTFKGERNELAQELFDHFDQFSSAYQVAMVDFFRFSDGKLTSKLIDLLKRDDLDKEVVCALLRYYEKYPVQAYKDTILARLAVSSGDDWEIVSTAATVLGKYPGEDTVQALKTIMSSKFWYIRVNAARSIAELGVEEESVRDILEGQDTFAREQLSYQIANRKERGIQNG